MRTLADTSMRAASRVVTDRRWAATSTAMALGFGLFIGVAIGPGASGTLAGAPPQIVELPASGGGGEHEAGEGATTAAIPAPSTSGEAGREATSESSPALEAPLETAPLEPLPAESAPPAPAPPAPTPEAPAPEEEEEPKPEGQPLEGVVVHVNPAAGSYALALPGGELVAVHSAKLPAAGTKLSLVGRPLENGTFAEAEKPERDGRAARASITGTVTFVDPDPAAPAYTVSGRGASVLVRARPDAAGAVPILPPLGSFATVDATFAKPAPEPAAAAPAEPPPPLCQSEPTPEPSAPASVLWQAKLKVEDVEPSTYLEVAGVIAGLCTDRPGVLLTADGAGEAGAQLFLLPGLELDPGRLEVGGSVLGTIEVGADGSLTLTGIASDERVKGADDPRSAQGDLAR